MKSNHIFAIVYKQYCDVLHNKTIILMMFLYPFISIFINTLSKSSVELLNTVLPMLVTMHILMSPIVCFSGVIAEEKERNTLRMLYVSNISGAEYLIGISICLVSFLLISTFPYYLLFSITGRSILIFFCVSFFGIVCSSILGSIIGIASKNQSAVGTVASPISLALGLLPILSNFNNTIDKISRFLYSTKVYTIVFSFRTDALIDLKDCFITFGLNFFALSVLFIIIFSRKDAHIFD